MTTRQLQALQDKYRRAERASEAARVARNEAIKAALAQGMTQTEVAAALDISQVQVHRLLRGKNGKGA